MSNVREVGGGLYVVRHLPVTRYFVHLFIGGEMELFKWECFEILQRELVVLSVVIVSHNSLTEDNRSVHYKLLLFDGAETNDCVGIYIVRKKCPASYGFVVDVWTFTWRWSFIQNCLASQSTRSSSYTE